MAAAFNVTVVGAAGGIGMPLSLLLKSSNLVKQLVLFDVVPVVEGVAVDLSHIDTNAAVVAITGDLKDEDRQKAQLHKSLEGSDVVVIPAGFPRKPGMTRDDLFKKNADIVKNIIEGIALVCPKAYICVISNPVNSNVPIAAEIMKKHGVLNPNKIFGVSTLDIVRSNTFVSEAIGKLPGEVNVRVVGGHSGPTILPILSEYETLDQQSIEKLTERIRNAGTEVVRAKDGRGSATLSMAYAGAKFTISLLKALAGEEGILECAFVMTDVVDSVDYFACPIKLGVNGVESVVGIGELSEYEETLLKTEVLPELGASIRKGVEYVTNLDS